ncbi:RNA helicase/RNAse III, putative [Talaromyces stipitatus ATCC 10500]|uniref:Dicer-like protein 1 n=1 Tax=Talaromyces stipitatus (strain ATCC 10500 / CBS 375.48 / QM 6759 / NRRL 1006) TaxID=441959 RepID=B8LY34_TALSN|nr:RNA helicase/RNAse III, putative [Talaromyces stipitatus ATCC 10500]EED23279.1 RNA helicase/RNAse III, putative [Talaromyces stipitatus ATCC 10500]
MEAPILEEEHFSASESENEEAAPPTAQSTRQEQKAFFKDLLSQAAKDLDSQELNRSSTAENAGSTRYLLTTQDFAATIEDPRDYQIELYERAKHENTIAVLATGSGKTLIAILLLKHIIQNELIDRGRGQRHRISFFLVDSVTLVFQQTAVLKNNLDQPVASIYGDMGLDLWNKDVWTGYFTTNMVIVCTADILTQCLLHSYITMEDINLLIFDEAHHAKKEHAYARIMKDGYLKANPASRPRIFGMTASPLDAKRDPVKAAHELESLLHSKIATASNLNILRQVVGRPEEEQWKYAALKKPFKTALYQTLENQYGDMECLKSIFAFSLQASSYLGPWCADRVWADALSEKLLPRFHGKITSACKRLGVETSAQKAESEISRLKQMSEMIANYERPSGLDILEQLSDKVQVLYRHLARRFEEAPNTKCIVFTKQRNTAKLLEAVFRELSVPNMRPGVLVGIRPGDISGMNSTYHQQFKATIEFRKGELNCIFATSVAEEGLDIPDCNLVVRFDLYDTLIQYIQSRGRARSLNSIYAHMVEIDNMEHETRLDEVHQAEEVMRRFCEALPEDRLLGDKSDSLNAILERDSRKRQYKIESTGATLTYHSAMTVLARYASSLINEAHSSLHPCYVTTQTKGLYECEVILPEASPIRGLIGKPEPRKSLAKQSAAFETCILLRRHGLLNDHFVSTYQRRLPAMRNAKLSITSKKTSQYSMIVKPAFWKKGCDHVPCELYLTVIMFSPAEPLQKERRNLVLLTRERLPQFPEFPIYLDDDVETTIRTISMYKALSLSASELELLTTFTLRIFQDLYNKVYEMNQEAMPYWLVPTASGIGEYGEDANPSEVIDWDTLQFVMDNERLDRNSASPEDFVGRFVYDTWNGKYRYFLTGVNTSFHPSDPPPSFVPHRRYMENIMEYGLSLYKNSRVRFLAECDWNQPVYDAELIPLRRNLLDKMSDAEKDVEKRVVVCLETQVISAIPAMVATSCLAFPAVITRFDSYLVARECTDTLGLKVQLEYALEAVTKDSDNTGEHRLEQIHFQRGMGKNYERLEFLGDCFLKMATSISLFVESPNDQEYDFHVNRMTLICNRNLFNTAIQRKIYEHIRSKGFSRRNWYPDGMKLLRGKANEDQGLTHALGEKTIADVCEALIGASLLSGGPVNRFDMAVKAVTALVNSDHHNVDNWAEYSSRYSLPPYQIKEADGFEKDLARQVEMKLGYCFQYPKLLRSAFTHPSYPSAWSTVPCYQRLEFLGDSLLDMVCVEDLYERFPDRDPQWLTEHKMAMVSNKFLGSLAVRLSLHTHLQYFSNPLQAQIARAVQDSQLAYDSHQTVDFWLHTDDPPKCLSDMVEAYLGAIFVDSGFDFGVIESFYAKHIKPYFEDMALYDTFANKHPTTFLHRKLTDDFGCIQYTLRAAEIPSVDGAPPVVLAAVLVHDVVLAQGTASSGRYAKIKASEVAMKNLEGLSVSRFREKYHCKCSRNVSSHGAAAPPRPEDMGCAI